MSAFQQKERDADLKRTGFYIQHRLKIVYEVPSTFFPSPDERTVLLDHLANAINNVLSNGVFNKKNEFNNMRPFCNGQCSIQYFSFF